MDEQLQQQIIQLVLAAMQGDQLANQLIEQIMTAAKLGNLQAVLIAQMIQQVALQLQLQQVRTAKFGAKLNYIRLLNGLCPEGYKVEYYKEGGQLCKRCMKVHQDGGEVAPKVTNVMDQFKVESAKCGRKMKRKAACGTKLPKDKCGSKVEMDKCGKKIKKRANGGDFSYFFQKGTK